MSLTVSDASLEDLARLSLSVPSMNGDDGSADNVSEIKLQAQRLQQVKSTSFPRLTLSLTLTEKLGRAKTQKFEKLKEGLILRGKLFEDPYFPANANCLYYSHAAPREVVWKRPREITQNPKFIAGSGVRFDVDQHDLGDCWYLAALATVATRPALLENVVPSNQSFEAGKYAGIFQFHFWRFGKWEQVIVDDRLPYNTKNERLCFCHNRDQPEEFWSALCEKAYAKCFGSYEALDGGLPQDALVDMTGAVGETVLLKGQLTNPDHLWKRMLTSNDPEFGALLTAGIFAPRNSTVEREIALESGLFARHAYSVTAAKEVSLKADEEEKVRLVRVRNPWGDRNEWKGKWSDHSSAWSLVSEETRQSLNLRIEQDGEFWLSYNDFIAHFDALMLAHLTPDTLAAVMFNDNRKLILNREKFEWGEKCFEGSWVRGISAGGRERPDINPQFLVELTRPPHFGPYDEVPLLISVMQMKRRLMRTMTGSDGNDLPIAFFIFKPKTSLIKKSYKFEELDYIDGIQEFKYDREIARTFFFQPGVYVVVPCVYYANMEGEFLVRFMTLGPAQAEPMEEDTDPVAPSSNHETELLSQLYDKYSGQDRFIDVFELHPILQELVVGVLDADHGFSWSTCIAILNCFDTTGNKRLDRSELKECWESIKTYHTIFRQLDVNKDGFFDANELPRAYRKLNLTVSRRVVAILVKLYGTKRGLMDLESFLMSITTLLSYSRKWLKNKDYVFGQINFDQYLLWEINDEIPDIDDHGIGECTDSSHQACAIL